jgi:outer membrane protein assembly factor BamA
VQETTIFREYGPVAGSTVRVGFESNPDLGNDWVTRQTADIDARYYLRLGTNGVLAFRGRGLRSWGRNPSYLAYGGNSEMRGYDYLQFYGQHAFFANVELRFPIIEAMLTPFGVLGGLRGTLYFDIGGAGLNGQGAPGTPPYVFAKQGTELYAPIIGYEQDILGNATPVYGKPEVVSGLRLVDGRASYGIGLESFLLGFPMHFDFSWKTLFNQQWEDLLFAPIGGHGVFRRMQFGFWIGYDF